jgi:arylsulfatase A-like enzyme
VNFIRENRDRPFFLYLPHYAVHTPLQAKPEVVAKYERVPEAERQGKPVYAAMVENLDDSVGRVMETLRELGLERDTMVIFTSDNGGFYNATSNAPLRANKGAYYEGGIRVPLLIKWPGVARPGTVSAEPVTSTDLYPTCLAAAGLPPRPHQHVDGLDLRPVLAEGKALGRSSLFWHFPHYNDHPHSVPSGVIRRGEWKLIETFDPAGFELYHLAADLGETRNLAAAEPARLAELRRELEEWRRVVGAEMMAPNPGYDPSFLPVPKGKKRKAGQ